jgi:hypothetical protein
MFMGIWGEEGVEGKERARGRQWKVQCTVLLNVLWTWIRLWLSGNSETDHKGEGEEEHMHMKMMRARCVPVTPDELCIGKANINI